MQKERSPRIIAMGGGGFSMEPENPLLDAFILSTVGRPRPRVCFIPTASGDADSYTVRFYEAFSAPDCEPTHLPLFQRKISDLREFVLKQDILYVGGGNTANMLAIWRAHGLDAILREAWEEGVVLCGLSAGSLCWFESGVTDSYGPELGPIHNGLGFLGGSHCPHYDGEELRPGAYHRLVRAEVLPAGWAVDDGAALVFEGQELLEVVSSRPQAAAYRVFLRDKEVCEEKVVARYLAPSLIL